MTLLRHMRFALLCAVFAVRDALRPRGVILQEVPVGEGMTVLDFGCGPGGYVVPLSRRVGAAGTVHALDANPLAVRRVERLAQRNGLGNVKGILSDGPAPLPAGTLDAVLIYDVFHMLPDPQAVLREMHRLLKPAGFVSFSDHHMRQEKIVADMTAGGWFVLSGKGRYTYTFGRTEA